MVTIVEDCWKGIVCSQWLNALVNTSLNASVNAVVNRSMLWSMALLQSTL